MRISKTTFNKIYEVSNLKVDSLQVKIEENWE